jgi:outer membrane protein TolC
MITRLVAEISREYYELVALDNQLATLDKNIELQSKALVVVKAQKQSAKVTELAVQKFEAEVAKTKSLRFEIAQQITETENAINYLVGRYPQPVARVQKPINALQVAPLSAGLPADLLQNRPDIRNAELELEAAKLDVKSARAEFFPSISLTAGAGYEAFNPAYLIQTPQSLLYGFIGELSAPLLNRKAIQANYSSAGARQLRAVYSYEQTVLNGYIEVVNTLSGIENLNQSLTLKNEQVLALSRSISIANNLFKSARADYMEVLMTQRDMLEATFELIETKKEQLNAGVTLYESLGGGWR